MQKILLSTLLLLVAILSSCSGTNNPVTAPDVDEMTSGTHGYASTGYEPNRYLWGFYEFRGDPEAGTMEVIPLRAASEHWNALKWLEQGPCTNCVKVTSFTDSGVGYYNVDVRITHPFGNPNLTGFDVRGIAIFDPGYTFPDKFLSIPDKDLGNGEYLDPWGYTNLYNAWTEGQGPGGLQGYIIGKFGSKNPAYPSALLNGFRKYWSDDPDNTRNAFYAGAAITHSYKIVLPSPYSFNYAVDACWAPPTVNPVVDPMTDFPIEANCEEPHTIYLASGDGNLTDAGGSLDIEVAVYDYQGHGSHADPFVECPELFDGTVKLDLVSFYPTHALYEGTISNTKLAPAGTYRMLVSVEDNENASAPTWLNLTAYQIFPVEVEETGGWAQVWGADEFDIGYEVVEDGSGNIYVAGVFTADVLQLVDFDPGPEIDWRMGNGGQDCFLSKFDGAGEYLYSRTWGSDGNDGITAMAVGPTNLMLTGYFQGTVDFAPGTDVDEITASGTTDTFLTAYSLDDTYQWTEAWGGDWTCTPSGIAVDDSANSYVVGHFFGTVDFDPSGLVLEYTTGVWTPAAFLTKFSYGGTNIGAVAWGNSTDTTATYPQDVILDAPDGCYVLGDFKGTVDFDPDAPATVAISKGEEDVFLSGFDNTLDFQYVRSWGSTGHDLAGGLSTIEGILVAVGGYSGTVDFDTSPGTDNHASNGGMDCFMNVHTANGDWMLSSAWGGSGLDFARDIDIKEAPGLYITGDFTGTVDFDPGAGTADFTSSGETDAFVTVIDPYFEYVWTAAFGSSDGPEWPRSIALCDSGDVYVTGGYQGTADFDPSGDVYEKTSHGSYDIFVEKIMSNGSW